MNAYAVRIRRELHQYPEIGFDLPRTLALLRRELDAIGVPYTEEYGKSSIVATVNPEKSHFTVGIRADIDALPIHEKNEVEYCSRIDGQMHACGHDAHTAIALATLKEIYEERDSFDFRIKFLFQSAEEYAPSGAKLMAEDGVMDDIDCIVALHCDTGFSAGTIAITPYEQNAISDGFVLGFFGKSAHAGNQERGIDAIQMAVQAYTAIELMIAKEIAVKERVIFNAGTIQGGTANNIIAEQCSMYCTLRTWNEELAGKIIDKIKRIGESLASIAGGSFSFEPRKHYPIVYNDPILTERVRIAAAAVVGEEQVKNNRRAMGGEDFAYFAQRKSGCMFRLGVRNEKRGIVNGPHTDRFDLDEDALEIGVKIFKQFLADCGTEAALKKESNG
ncbi:MAG: amidohydrolase [Clostridia bacterium]|nr:amidohydrolase [Clostridia bacterium]